MKRKLLSVLLVLVLCLGLLPVMSHAADVGYDVTGGKIYFDPTTGTITGCEDSVTAADIPSEIYDVKVTAIGGAAFSRKQNLTSVTIPDGVTIIHKNAFYLCRNLSSVSIPGSVTTIEDGGLYGTFYGCVSLQNITLPEGLQTIGNSAFQNCTALRTITIPNSVTSVGNNAFQDCKNLTSVTIGKGLKEISDYMFWGCEKLSSVTIPDNIETIGCDAFRACKSLKTIVIPDTVTDLKTYNGRHCKNCESLTYASIGNGATFVPVEMFNGCKNLKSVSLGNNVTKISLYAFSGCGNLTSIFIPKTVTEFGGDAFSRCSNLSDVYYGGSVADWAAIKLGYGNDALAAADIHFNSTGLPNGDVPSTPATPTTPSTPTTPADPSQPFTDVPANAYYADAVKWAVANGVTAGTSPTTFSPNETVTRGQAVTFLWRAAGKPVPERTSSPFSDVKTGDYFYQPVLWAMEQGVTVGTDATHFSPGDTLTRAHIVTFLWRAAGKPGSTGASPWYADAETWGKKNDLLSGTAVAYAPGGSCPRSDVVTYLYRADQKGVF